MIEIDFTPWSIARNICMFVDGGKAAPKQAPPPPAVDSRYGFLDPCEICKHLVEV